jgi:hypothetical protein
VAKIEGFRVRNYRALRDITLGQLWNRRENNPLTPMTAVIGKNGVGKSSLFDAFGFLADCLKVGVEEACDLRGRGGIARIKSQGLDGPIEFEIYYKEDATSRPITYELAIQEDRSGRPYVSKERLRQRRKSQTTGWPFSFLILEEGRGVAWKGEEIGVRENEVDITDLLSQAAEKAPGDEGADREIVELEDKRRLGIATLGSLKQHPRIRVHAYKGIGRIPKNLKPNSEPAKRILMDQLLRLLQGYGKAFSQYPKDYLAHVAIICDLDDKDAKQILKELKQALDSCAKKPHAEFCLAIEEGEAWLLGDRKAVEEAYPKANKAVLNSYVQDSICGTWEIMADAVYAGGAAALKRQGWQAVGHEKSKWADAIAPKVDHNRNVSPSFSIFLQRLRALGY